MAHTGYFLHLLPQIVHIQLKQAIYFKIYSIASEYALNTIEAGHTIPWLMLLKNKINRPINFRVRLSLQRYWRIKFLWSSKAISKFAKHVSVETSNENNLKEKIAAYVAAYICTAAGNTPFMPYTEGIFL